MITLNVEPRVVKSWDQFRREGPRFSVALDGYVRGRTAFAAEGPHANFNHHEDVDRLSTRSSCGQLYVALKQGLLDTFQQDGKVTVHAFINDCDQDVSLAIWLLRNGESIHRTRSDERVRNLVLMEDLLDTTAGAYPLASADLSNLAWIFEPYFSIRPELSEMQGDDMARVIDAVGERITRFVRGDGARAEVDARYEILGGGQGWRLVRAIGPYARSKLFEEGLGAYVLVEPRPDGGFTYAIGKMSPYVDFPIDELYSVLNREEDIGHSSADAWGGGDIVGGSPRSSGSRLTPEQVAHIINSFLSKRRQ